MSRCQPKRHQLGALEPGRTQDVPPEHCPSLGGAAVPTKEGTEDTNCPNSQQPLKTQSSPEPAPLAAAPSEALGRKNMT